MQSVKFENSKGEHMSFGIQPPLVLQSIQGTGNIDANIQTQKSPFQDGRTFLGSKLEPREIFMQIVIVSSVESELFALREKIQKLFNPKLGEGILTYSTPNGEKYIKGVADGTPTFSQYMNGSVTVGVSLYCVDPFWYDFADEDYTFNTPYVPMFEFPFFSDPDNDIEFGYEQETVFIRNNGTVYTPVIIEFLGGFKSATLTNKTTGDYIEIKKELLETESLTVNTSFGKRKIHINKTDGSTENGFKYISFDSKFLQLEVGENEIVYQAEAVGNTTIKLKWNNRYLGL